MVENINFFGKSISIFNFFFVSYNKAGTNKFKNIFRYWVTIICGLSMVTLAFLDLLEAIHSDRLDIKLTKLLFMFVLLVVIQKTWTVTYTDDKINGCIDQLKVLSSKFENKSYFENAQGQYNKLFLIGILTSNISVVLLLAGPGILFRPRKLFFQPNVSFLNLEKSPNFEIMFIFQSIAGLILSNINVAYDTIYCGLLCVSAGALKSISREIREIDEYITDHQASESKLKNIIEKIIKTNSFIDAMSDVFAITTFTHILYLSAFIALGLYVISFMRFDDVNFFSMTLSSITCVFLLWIYCFFGQNVVNKSQQLHTELYFLKWYDASKNFKVMVLVSMTVLQKQRFVFAGKIIPISMETFGQVLRGAYTFFAFMNEFR